MAGATRCAFEKRMQMPEAWESRCASKTPYGMSTYISVPNMGPWYVVVLPTPHRDYLSEANRFTLQVATPEEVEDAHKEFSAKGKELGVTELRELQINGKAHFLLSDISKNWWEITS